MTFNGGRLGSAKDSRGVTAEVSSALRNALYSTYLKSEPELTSPIRRSGSERPSIDSIDLSLLDVSLSTTCV